MGGGCVTKQRIEPRNDQPYLGIFVLQVDVNRYLNQFHLFHLSRLEQKYNEICRAHSRSDIQMNFAAFKIFF